jgi:GT2 family glycosyltransferase
MIRRLRAFWQLYVKLRGGKMSVDWTLEDKISYIVSSKSRPDHLAACLASIAVQQGPKEIIVADTTWDSHLAVKTQEVCNFFGATYFPVPNSYIYVASARASCSAVGRWFCFPNDDSYYMPMFSEFMIREATTSGSDLVLCDMVYDPRINGKYHVIDTKPVAGAIDKTCFMVKRDIFNNMGFPHVKDVRWTDFYYIEKLVKNGVKWSKADGGALVVHN